MQKLCIKWPTDGFKLLNFGGTRCKTFSIITAMEKRFRSALNFC